MKNPYTLFTKRLAKNMNIENKKRIVILRSNPVNPDSRVEKEAYTLFKNGYKVLILCWDREANHRPQEEFVTVHDKKIPIIRFGLKASYGEGFKNIIPFLKFQVLIRKWLKKHKNDYDIVHACDFDTAFSTYKIALKLKKRVVFDIFDFLYGNPKGLLQRTIKREQIKIINVVDATIICSEERRQQIKGSSPKKLCVIHNSPSIDQLPQNLSKQTHTNARIRACYVGILQDGRLLREIGEFFAQHNEFELHIGGFGYLSDYFAKLASEYENIFFYGKIPYEKTLELENNCDLLLAIYDPTVENHIFAAPNKFYESLFLGKPLVMAKGTGMSHIVEDNNIGVTIEYSYAGLETGMNEIKTMLFNFERVEIKCLNIFKANYSWETMSSRLLSLYEKI